MVVNLEISKLIFKAPGENWLSRGMSINSTGAKALGGLQQSQFRHVRKGQQKT